MKRHFIIIIVGLVFAGPPVHAQEGVIRVIQPDGSVEEAEIPAAKPPAAPQKPETALPAPAASAPTAATTPVPKAQKPAPKSPSDMAVSPPAKTQNKPKNQVSESASKKPAKAQNKKDKKPKDEAKIDGPLPAPDLQAKPMMPLPPLPKPAPGEYISKTQALNIALGYAPPVRSYDVLPRTYHDGRFIYVVRFITDQGPRDILIDASDGSVINLAR
jgi:uncharacterized membrane protein YkoI